MNLSDDVPLVEMLRELKKDLKNIAVYKIVSPLISYAIQVHIEKIWGNQPKVGVFGPYADSGEEILHTVSQKIAKRGYLAIMGSGFYHQKNPTEFHEITELFPSIVTPFMALPYFEFFLYRYIIPSLIDKAAANLHPTRTTAYELEGCFEEQVPALGYVVQKGIKKENFQCPYLDSNITDKGTGLQCKVDAPSKCPKRAPNPPNCPFYDVVNIPWVQKTWFMTSKDWLLVALDDIDKIDDYLDIFL